MTASSPVLLRAAAIARFRAGDVAAALEAAEQLIARRPHDVEALDMRGSILGRMGRYREALASFDQALLYNPTFAGAWLGRGKALAGLDRSEEAASAYRRAVALQPGLIEAWVALGIVLTSANCHAEASDAYAKAIAINGNSARAWCGRGMALSAMKQTEQAIASLQKALSLDQHLVEAWVALGNLCAELSRHQNALDAWGRALAINPDFPGLRGARIRARLSMADWTDVDREAFGLVAAIRAGQVVTAPFNLLALSSSSEEQLQCARLWADRYFRAAEVPVCNGERYHHEKMRIGYVSPDFREHPVATLAVGLFEHHDRRRFEVTAICLGSDDGSDLRRRITGGADRFIAAGALGDGEIAKLIKAAEISILVDLAGFTTGARTGVFALRPAPIQVNYLGYAGTMGADYYDYIIADPVIVPAQEQHLYAEKPVWMPDSFMTRDIRGGPCGQGASRQQLGLPEQSFVFCCFNSTYKINPRVFDAWMRILRRVDAGVLWLSEQAPAARDNLRAQAVAAGIDPQRLVFASRVPQLEQHLSRLGRADLFLDTLPYNAHATANDALWAGLPVLTCRGETFAGRVAATLLTALDMSELITASWDEYESLAVALASNPDRMAAVKAKLGRNRANARLFDPALFTRQIEAAFAAMHERHATGLPPAAIRVRRWAP